MESMSFILQPAKHQDNITSTL